MRSTIIAAAAFAASAVAIPYANPDVVTAYATDVQYVTNVVTVTEGGAAPAAPTTTAVAAADEGSSSGNNGGWHWPHKPKSRKTKTKTRTPPPAESTPEPAPTTTEAAPPPAYTPEPEPTSAAEPAPSGVSGYNDIVVAHHNVHRSNHSAPEVVWDAALAATAQKIAAGCVYAHDTEMDGGGYGQNIAAGVEANNVSAVITDLFYNGEVGYYDGMYGSEPSMAQFELWGHFSQIVWQGTKKVGCATQHCANGLGNVGSTVSPYFTVCNYGPPGNYGGEYADNVLAPKNNPTVQWNYAQ